jgi:hypothetical protein
MRNQGRPQREKEIRKKNNHEDKVNEDDNELLGLHLCAGVLGCYYGAGDVRHRAGGSPRPSLQRGHAKGLVSVDLRRVRKLRWEPGTESHYARNPVQRRWYDVQSIRHCERRKSSSAVVARIHL